MKIRCMGTRMGLVSFVVGNQEEAQESLELHELISQFRKKLEPSTAESIQMSRLEEIIPIKTNHKALLIEQTRQSIKSLRMDCRELWNRGIVWI